MWSTGPGNSLYPDAWTGLQSSSSIEVSATDTFEDLTGNGHDFTLEDGATVVGNLVDCFGLTSGSGYVRCVNLPVSQSATNYTYVIDLETGSNFESAGQDQSLGHFADGSGTGRVLLGNLAGTKNFYSFLSGGNSVWFLALTNLTRYRIVLRKSGDDLSLFVDGSLIDTITGVVATPSDSTTINVAINKQGTSLRYDCGIYTINWYDIAVTDTVAELLSTDAIAMWRLSEAVIPFVPTIQGMGALAVKQPWVSAPDSEWATGPGDSANPDAWTGLQSSSSIEVSETDTFEDLLGNGHDWTLENGATVVGEEIDLYGRTGNKYIRCLSFPLSQDDLLVTGGTYVLDFNTGTETAQGGVDMFLGQWTTGSGTGNVLLGIEGGSFELYTFIGGSKRIFGGLSLANQTRYQVCLRFIATQTWQVWVNGTELGNVVSGVGSNDSVDFFFGTNNAANSWNADVGLRSLSVYNEPVSDAVANLLSTDAIAMWRRA